MDDASSTLPAPWCMPILLYLKIVISHARVWFDKAGYCHFCGSCGKIVQVLSLPEKPSLDSCKPLKSHKDMEKYDPATVGQLVAQSFGGSHD